MRTVDRFLMLGDALVLAGYVLEQFERVSAPLLLVALGHAVLLGVHVARRRAARSRPAHLDEIARARSTLRA